MSSGSFNLKCVDLQVVLAASVAEDTEAVREALVVVVGEAAVHNMLMTLMTMMTRMTEMT